MQLQAFKRRNIAKYVILIILGAVVYAEWFVYQIQPYFWKKLECPGYEPDCLKILFIADPQIQGENAEPVQFWPFNGIVYQDSDRYLTKTFAVAIRHLKPDVLIFLGDLMDEGSISSPKQFSRYVKRLANIFDTTEQVQWLWLPGDNDIGGENEAVRLDKVQSFYATFNQPLINEIKNVTFIQANGITKRIPPIDGEFKRNGLTVILSHYPLTTRYIYGKELQSKFNPDIYFAAHDHQAKYVKQTRKFTLKDTTYMTPDDNYLEITDFSEDVLYEIYVPTCSYRMGTSVIGFGAAVIDNHTNVLRYTVLWSPQRFPNLIGYLALSVTLSIIIILAYRTRIGHLREIASDKNLAGSEESLLKQV